MRHLSFLLLGIFFSIGVSLEAQKQFDVDQLSDFENYLKTEIDADQIGSRSLNLSQSKKSMA